MNNISVKSRKSGFTLIELLVVIAIIAILAAILFPVFARARENARRSSCQSNEKQIALGFNQYIQDNNEKYPAASGWQTAIFDYTKSNAILKCPSAAGAGTFDYSYNSLMDNKNENKVDNSAATVLVAEASRTSAATAATSASASSRHFDGSNYAFVDGHVKWIKGAVSATDTTGNVPTFFVPAAGGSTPPAPDPTETTSDGLGTGITTSEIAFANGNNTGSARSVDFGPFTGPVTTCATLATKCGVPTAGSTHLLVAIYTSGTFTPTKNIPFTVSKTSVSSSLSATAKNSAVYTEPFLPITLPAVGQDFTLTVVGDKTQTFYFFVSS